MKKTATGALLPGLRGESWAQHFRRAWILGSGYFHLQDLSAFRPVRPAVPRRSVQRVQSHQLPIGRSDNVDGIQQSSEESNIRPGKRHLQPAPIAVRTEA